MKAIGVIPARLGSTRLAEKVLRLIDGRPMIQHVWERASKAKKLADVIVACDDDRIVDCVETAGGKVLLTRKDHPNGSSRVAEIAQREKADILINIQGDEPMIHPDGIDQIVEAFEKNPSLQVATLAVPRHDREDYLNPNVVKVVCDAKGNALYFSRSPIPHYRGQETGPVHYLKHLGIYGYRRDFLLKFVTWETGVLEDHEKLEQLRILEQGFDIRVIETLHDAFSVDTAEDLKLVESKIKSLSHKAGVL
jgi:3-deoxy-manno-octulosonate cytidylyltransferase (CMP-KDO synthetase)